LGELDFSMSTGHVSALDRVINTQESERINMFQIDAAVNEGNSGGPVYNGMGEVVGIVTAKYSSSGVEGLGFAIPINDVKAIADDLINIGYVTGKAYMGVSFDSRYNSMYSQYYGMPLGAYVGEVTPHTAAEKAGLKSGDIITAIGGYTVESYNDIKGALRHFSSGETAVLTVYRAGDELHLSITFDEAKPDT
ncbi:MAG: PDZ domain-containing protein, partial [Oscillospiraceae bacterium]|nr:PDZ domain-containing protein [Oscillospiraceae bacterium]